MIRRQPFAIAAGVGAAAIAWIQLRGGIVPIFDTASYWSGAEAVAHGHPFTTTLAPYFSNFSVIEFLDRGGRTPFVDFPVGYPAVAGLLGAVIGVRAAMMAVTIVSAGAIAAVIGAGAGVPRNRSTQVLRAVVGLGVVTLPVFRLVTQATLSEPLFAALTLGAVAALLRARRTGRGDFTPAVLVGAAGLVRFLGAALAVLPMVDTHRRHHRWPRTLAVGAAGFAPAAVNAMWAGRTGGHGRAWHPLAFADLRAIVRSVTGWFEAGNGDVGLTFFGGGGSPAWWAWAVAAVWLAAVVVAGWAFATGRPRWLPEPLMLCLAAAGLLTLGLVVAMLWFDALVIPDNRLMLPAGVLTLAGLAWSVELPDRAGRALLAAAAVVAVWLGLGVRPGRVGERFANAGDAPAHAVVAGAVGERIVVSNDADGVHWFTGKPSAYLPIAAKPLSGEVVDSVPLYEALPCALAEAGAAVVLADASFLGGDDRAALDALVAAGRLAAEPEPGATVYRPTPTACG